MKKISLLILILILTSHFSCERDDICPETTPTTPRLIIDLHDFSNQEEKKNVLDLRVQGVDNNEALPGYDVGHRRCRQRASGVGSHLRRRAACGGGRA